MLAAAVSVLGGMAALVLYERYLKPCPKDQYGLKNVTVERLRHQEWVHLRQEILSQIESAFKEKKSVLLVGEPGSGKSSTSFALAEQMTEGKICRFIKNGQLFSCGAHKFKAEGPEGISLDMLAERFKFHKEQVVFFFDEFHSFFKVEGERGGSLAENIKVFCDDFRFVIGATTTAEFERYIKNQTAIIDRRFLVVPVPSLDKSSIKIMLSNYLQVKYPTLLLEEGILDYLIEKALAFNPKTSQVDAAKSLLNRVVKAFDPDILLQTQLKIDRLDQEKTVILQELNHCKRGQASALMEKLERKQTEISDQKKQLAHKQQRWERLKKIEALYLKIRQESFTLADPEMALKEHSPMAKKWIGLQVKMTLIDRFLQAERAALHLPRCLDQTLIDTLVQERARTGVSIETAAPIS